MEYHTAGGLGECAVDVEWRFRASNSYFDLKSFDLLPVSQSRLNFVDVEVPSAVLSRTPSD